MTAQSMITVIHRCGAGNFDIF